jgi:hypothetical protein
MAQADLLIELFKSATNGDQQNSRKSAEALIQEEQAKGHRIRVAGFCAGKIDDISRR